MTSKYVLPLSRALILLLVVLLVEIYWKFGLQNKNILTSSSLDFGVVHKANIGTNIRQESVEDAGQGKYRLVLNVKKTASSSSEYKFHVLSLEDNSSLVLFTDTIDASKKYVTPFNSFAPDDKKLFIELDENGLKNYFVFNVDGSAFKDGSKFIDIRKAWLDSKNKSILTEATGWADKDLVIVKTNNADGTQGFNYWFVVGTRKFLQLSH